MFHLNCLAFLMLVIAGMVGVGASYVLFAGSERASGAIAGIVMFAVDAWYRSRPMQGTASDKRWWSARRGGFIAIVPSWLMGCVLVVMAATQPYWSSGHVR